MYVEAPTKNEHPEYVDGRSGMGPPVPVISYHWTRSGGHSKDILNHRTVFEMFYHRLIIWMFNIIYMIMIDYVLIVNHTQSYRNL